MKSTFRPPPKTFELGGNPVCCQLSSVLLSTILLPRVHAPSSDAAPGPTRLPWRRVRCEKGQILLFRESRLFGRRGPEFALHDEELASRHQCFYRLIQIERTYVRGVNVNSEEPVTTISAAFDLDESPSILHFRDSFVLFRTKLT